MKRIVALLLAMLLLAGCAPEVSDETTEATQEQTTAVPTEPGSYVPNHTIEQETDGAVQAFVPDVADISAICAMGNNLLIMSGEENVTLTLLTGQKGTIYAIAQTTLNLKSDLCSFVATADGFAYYDDSINAVIYLNIKLREDSRLALPDEISGKPFISPSGNVYYSIADQIREVSPETQIPRMIKQIAGKDLKLQQFAFDGKVLGCTYTDNHNFVRSLYVSGETGETLREGELLQTLETWKDSYFATRMDGIIKQQIVGTMETSAKSMNSIAFAPLLPLNSVLLANQTDAGQMLSLCDLSSGKITSQLSLGSEKISSVAVTGSSVWILTADDENGNVLYRWDPSKTAVDVKDVHIGTLYTANTPDTAGLEVCQQRVDAINKQYNVKIRIWQEGVKVQEGHTLVPEYQTVAISAMLDKIETALKRLPDGFMRKTGDRNTVRICVVREIDGGVPAINFWDKDGDVFLVFAIDADFEREFPLMLGYPLVSRVLGNSVEMDYWTNYNPKDFVYGEQNSAYTEGEKRFFADSASMDSITDDRSRVFGYALMADNEAMFESDAMQGKLKLLCEAIRDSYRLTRYKETLPWEQYLKTPITPQ